MPHPSFVSKASLLAAAISASCFAYAEENAAPDEIVVTSSRIPQSLRQIGTSVSVITETEIEAYGNLSLVDVLRQQPAIASSNSGGPGKATTLRIRGEEGFRTLTIFDGMRLSDPSGPQIGSQMEHLLSTGIARVEILRGPQGLAYGADAGGVVSLSSRQSEPGFNASAGAQTGSFGTRQYTGHISAASEQGDLFISAADLSTDGFNARPSDNVLKDKDGYENQSFHGRVGWQASEAVRFELAHRLMNSEAQFDGCYLTSTVHDCQAIADQKATRASASYRNSASSHELSYATTRSDRDSLSEGVSTFATTGELNRLEYNGSLTSLPGFNLAFGADLEEVVENVNSRDNLGIYLEYLSDFSEQFFITAGVRHDDNDDFGTNTSYRFSAAYLYDLADGATVKLRSSLGTGFRAPSPYEIGYNQRPGVYPPASLVTLKQEESRGYESGVEYFSGTRLHLEAVHFNQKVRDAISFDMISWSGYIQDLGTSTSRGLELSARIDLDPNWQLRVNHTYNQTTQPDGQPRIRRPEHLSNLGVSYYGLDNRLTVNSFYRFSRKSFDSVGGALVSLDNLAVLDISGSYQLTDRFSINARVENLTEEKYQEVFDYNTPGRAAYIGVRLDF